MELEEANKKSLKWAIRLRSFSRIVFLIITTTVLFTGFYAIFEYFAFYDGMQKINSNSRLTMNITNCRVHIVDSVI
jgi:predicted MFS family arabinose efflux permease